MSSWSVVTKPIYSIQSSISNHPVARVLVDDSPVLVSSSQRDEKAPPPTPVDVSPPIIYSAPLTLTAHVKCGSVHKKLSGVQVGFHESEYSRDVEVYLDTLCIVQCKARVVVHNMLEFARRHPLFDFSKYSVFHNQIHPCLACHTHTHVNDLDDSDEVLKIFLRPKLLGGKRKKLPQGPPGGPKLLNEEKAIVKEEKHILGKVKKKTKIKKDEAMKIASSGAGKELASLYKHNGSNAVAPKYNLNSGFLGNSSLIQEYVKALSNPWEVQPPNMGYGIFTNGVNKMQMFLKFTLITTNNDLVITLNPNACCNTQSTPTSTNFLNSFVSYAQLATSATAWATSANIINTPASNCSIAGSAGTAVRVCSAGLKVEVGQAATSAAGMIFAGRIPLVASYGAIDGYTNLTAISAPWNFSRRVNITGCAKIIWAPMDTSDFAFVKSSSTMYANLGTFIQPLVSGVTGVPSGTELTITAVVNVEIGAGTANASNVLSAYSVPAQYGSPSIASSGMTPESLMHNAGAEGVPNVPTITSGGDQTAEVPWYQEIWNGVGSTAGWIGDHAESIGTFASLLGDFF